MVRAKWMPLLPILGAFFILSIIYARATPILEASDELWHFGMVDYLADNRALPVQDPTIETTYRQEGSQPPLYYTLAAILVSGVNRDDFESLLEYNPHAQVGNPGAVGNKNILLRDSLNPPYEGTVQAVFMIRGLSILLASVTIFAVYATTIQISGPSYAMLAAGLTAFNPMFLFISSSVNNDNLVTALTSLIIWQVVVMGWHGFKLWRSILIAVLIALASLSKLSGLVLIPVVLFAAGYIAYRDDKQREFVTLLVLIGVAWAAIAGWWYVRNILLYGELFGTQMMVQVAGPRAGVFTPLTLINEFEGFRISYWGWFGGLTILTFPWFYWLTDALTVIAIIGLVLALRKSLPYIMRDMQEYGRVFAVTDLLNMYWLYAAAVFAATVALGLIGVITWTAQTYASQGRLLFPFIVGISALLASGLQYFVRQQRKWLLSFGVSGGLGMIALVIPFISITPAYQPPNTVPEVPETATQVYARFDDIELLGYEIADDRYRPGEMLPLTVYWRALEPSDRDLSAFLVALDSNGNRVGAVDTYPGGGTLRTTTWEPGVIYEDVYGIRLRGDFTPEQVMTADPLSLYRPPDEYPQQFDMRVQVGWYDFETRNLVDPTDASDDPLRSVLLDAGAFVGDFQPQRRYLLVRRGIRYEDQITLTGYRLPRLDQIRLSWRVNRHVNEDYTVFVQVFDERTGEMVGQGDAPPPLSTSYWRRGDRLLTIHDIEFNRVLTPSQYSVYVGWYDPDDLSRLNLRNDEDNAHRLFRFSFP
jgi:hypothetical protein